VFGKTLGILPKEPPALPICEVNPIDGINQLIFHLPSSLATGLFGEDSISDQMPPGPRADLEHVTAFTAGSIFWAASTATGGALSGTYPNPDVAAGAIGPTALSSFPALRLSRKTPLQPDEQPHQQSQKTRTREEQSQTGLALY